jgi:hypothetical protein
MATDLAIAALKMDGDVSDIFEYYTARAAAGLASIRSKGKTQPGISKTTGTRDTGTK